MLNLSRNTVRRYLRSEGLPRYQREARPSKPDQYKQSGVGKTHLAIALDYLATQKGYKTRFFSAGRLVTHHSSP
jgi:hypothetical protein